MILSSMRLIVHTGCFVSSRIAIDTPARCFPVVSLSVRDFGFGDAADVYIS